MDHRDEPGWIRIEGKEMESVLEVRTYARTTINLLVRPGALKRILLESAYYFYSMYVIFYPDSFIVGTYCCLMGPSIFIGNFRWWFLFILLLYKIWVMINQFMNIYHNRWFCFCYHLLITV